MGAMLTLTGFVHAARPALAATIAISVFAACGGGKEEQPPRSTPTAPAPGAAAEPGGSNSTGAPAPPYTPAPAVTQASWAPDALEELLAPIALYPDPLLGQILAASINSQEVLDAGNWLLLNEGLAGQALDDAAAQAGFGPAMRSLVQFPTVIDMLCQQIDWTRQLGSAFSSDQKSVLDAVQRLRAQAAEVGNLKSTPQQTVEKKTENDKVVVEVKPADPQIVYVPQYNPQVVYTTPPPAPAPTSTTVVHEHEEDTVSTGAAIAGGLLAFGVGVMIGNAMHDDYYPSWGYGAVYYGPRPFYPPAYVYRPAYGPAFRPAYGYAPPANYRNRYNSPNNVIINNNDYYNRFDHNRNLQADNARSPLREPSQNRAGQNGVGGGAQNRAAQNPATANRQESWKGQSSYAGARPEAKPATAGAGGEQRLSSGQTDATRTAAADTRHASLSDSAASQRAQTDRSARVDRGYGESTGEAPGAGADSRSDRADLAPANAPDRSGSADRQSKTAGGERDSAFSGARTRDGGSFDRSASARGRASAGGGQAGSRGGGGARRR